MKSTRLLLPHGLSLILAAVFVCSAIPSRAQWIGAGAGGTGTDFNDPLNWTGGTISGVFTGNTTDATITLTQPTTSVTSLNLTWAGSNAFTLNGNGTGANEVLAISGGIIVPRGTTAAVVTIGSDVTLDFGTITSTRTIQPASTTGSGYAKLTINGLITGTAGAGGSISIYNNVNAGAVTFSNTANSFDAPLTVGATLYFTSIGNVNGGPSALGAPTSVANGTITLGKNSALRYIGTTDQSSDRVLVMNPGSGYLGIYNDSTTGATLTYSSNLSFTNYNANPVRIVASDASSTLVFTGVISNAGSAVMSANYAGGKGTVVFANTANTYAGGTSITEGTLRVTKLADGGQASSIGSSSNAATNLAIDINGSGARLQYVGTGDSTDRLFTIRAATIESSGTGALKFTNTGAVGLDSNGTRSSYSLTLDGTNTGDNLFAGSLGNGLTNSTVIKTALNKKGTGKWIVSGENTYTGNTTINDGTLLVTGSLMSGLVYVRAGTFGGAGGTTTGNVTIGDTTLGAPIRDAFLAIGGTFTASGTLTFNADSTFNFSMDSSSGLADKFVTSGLAINSNAAFNFTDLGNGSAITLNETLTLIDNTGATAISGSFGNLAEGATFVSNGITWQASYLGGTGNDLTLTAISISVPEPEVNAMILGSLLVMGFFIRRRRVTV